MLQATINAIRSVYSSARRCIEQAFFDKAAGIDTTEVVQLRDLGLASGARQDYHATPWLPLKRVLSDIDITDNDVFIDFGCGKGRVLYQAALYPFRRIIGVELSADLAQIARANLERARATLRCKNVEIVVEDAVCYNVPDDVTHVYFFDPFHGEIFGTVVHNLLASLHRRPRELTIIYLDPHEEQALLNAGAKLVAATSGLRPTKRWANENSMRVYKLGTHAIQTTG